MAAPLTLFGRRSSLNVQKVMFGLHDLLPHAKITRVDAAGKYGFPAGYQNLNPNMLVPLLQIDDKRVIWESNSIIRWAWFSSATGSIAKPTDPFAVSEWDRWCDWASDKSIQAPLLAVHGGLVRRGPGQLLPRKNEAKDLPKAAEEAALLLLKQFGIVERHLKDRRGKGKYAVVESAAADLTPADYVLAPSLYRFINLSNKYSLATLSDGRTLQRAAQESLPTVIEYLDHLEKTNQHFRTDVVEAEAIWYGDHPEK